MTTVFSHTEKERKEIQSVALDIAKSLTYSGLTQQNMTIALGFAAKLILADALSKASSPPARSEADTTAIAKDALVFGFEQPVGVNSSGPMSGVP